MLLANQNINGTKQGIIDDDIIDPVENWCLDHCWTPLWNKFLAPIAAPLAAAAGITCLSVYCCKKHCACCQKGNKDQDPGCCAPKDGSCNCCGIAESCCVVGCELAGEAIETGLEKSAALIETGIESAGKAVGGAITHATDTIHDTVEDGIGEVTGF